jgi:Raf kinase inhibitor-like YbhB/YbcL family protein
MKRRSPALRAVLAMLAASAVLFTVAACDEGGGPAGSGGAISGFVLASGAFEDGAPIPTEYTCDGGSQPLPLTWQGAPGGTAEYAIVMDDTDANGFVHWVVAGIPGTAPAIANPLPAGVVEGRNGKGTAGYTGPCPPTGTHHYRVTLYALSAPLGLTASADADAVRAAAAGKTLGTAKLTGTYTRSPGASPAPASGSAA